MKNVTVLIPYYGGASSPANGNTPVGKRLDYLRRTVGSVLDFSGDIRIGTCNLADYEAVRGEGGSPVLLDTEPQYVPAELCRRAQGSDTAELVYVTEADQVLHYSPEVISRVSGKNYLVPHRLEQHGPLGQGENRGLKVEFDGKPCAVCNGAPQEDGSGYYKPDGVVESYGGAFLASAELFNDIPFQNAPSLFVEHITGFYAACTGTAFKTSDWRGFFVEHLSGYDFHCSV